ncbi:hypothetical protein C8Q75DRAFT_776738 [Abortiporus biennis]|nr:hypothetical protein C8Q75DRAFT_776738 [Abortiporus biennis]
MFDVGFICNFIPYRTTRTYWTKNEERSLVEGNYRESRPRCRATPLSIDFVLVYTHKPKLTMDDQRTIPRPFALVASKSLDNFDCIAPKHLQVYSARSYTDSGAHWPNSTRLASPLRQRFAEMDDQPVATTVQPCIKTHSCPRTALTAGAISTTDQSVFFDSILASEMSADTIKASGRTKPKRPFAKFLDLALPGATKSTEDVPLTPPELSASSQNTEFTEASISTPLIPSSPNPSQDGFGHHAEGPSASDGSFILPPLVRRLGTILHHPYSTTDAPYMASYSATSLHNDYCTYELLHKICPDHSPTFHNYDMNPPLQVLDLGCGEGYWAAEAATTWKHSNTKVTAFDLFDLGNALRETLDKDVRSNITWVSGNFITSPLPFPDNTFDLVRMANLALAIPTARLPDILADVKRVLKPGGRLELIDDELFFPHSQDKPGTMYELLRACKGNESVIPGPSGSPISSPLPSPTMDDGHALFCDPPQKMGSSSGSMPSRNFLKKTRTSKDMERVFENMLETKYEIYPRPHEFLEEMLRSVFGPQQAHKLVHIRLAVPTHETAVERYLPQLDKPAKSKGRRSLDGVKRSKTPTGERDRKEKRSNFSKLERSASFSSDRYHRHNHFTPSPTPPLPVFPTTVPQNVTPKAAKFFGVSPVPRPNTPASTISSLSERSMRRKDSLEFESCNDGSVSPSVESSYSSSPTDNSFPSSPIPIAVPIPSRPQPMVMPPKAARMLIGDLNRPRPSPENLKHSPNRSLGRSGSPAHGRVLGGNSPIFVSPETMSKSTFMRFGSCSSSSKGSSPSSSWSRGIVMPPPSSASPSKTSKYYQPTGLIVLPAKTFIPFEPEKLDWHVGKNMNLLLACKFSLQLFISEQIGPDGKPVMEEEEVEDLLWEYDIFRRRRLNMPWTYPDIDFQEIDEDIEVLEANSTKGKSRFRLPSYKDDSSSLRRRAQSLASFNDRPPLQRSTSLYDRDRTDVRIIRVFEAEKPL